jgi:hypothetical protein
MKSLDDEYQALLKEQHVLEREHVELKGQHPVDMAAHEAHRHKLRRHARKLHDHIVRLRREAGRQGAPLPKPKDGVKARGGSAAKGRTEAALLDREQTRAAKRRFDAADEKGRAALARGDLKEFSEAVAEEKAAVQSLPVNREKKR